MTPYGNPDTPPGEDEYEITTLQPHYDEEVEIMFGIWQLLLEKKIHAVLEASCRVNGRNIAAHIVIEPRIIDRKSDQQYRVYAAAIAFYGKTLNLRSEDFRFEHKAWAIEDPRFKFEDLVEYVIHASHSSPTPKPHPQFVT